jgi:hypothetical protein
MKNASKSTGKTRNFDMLISKLSENEILTIQALNNVRGGDGEANGDETIIIIPK